MGVALANLIGRAGSLLFREYYEKQLGRSPPQLAPENDRRSFGRVMEAAVRRDLSPADYALTWRILQRAEDLALRNAKDCLRFAALQLASDIGDLRRSAFQEALFCYLEHRQVFFAAEAIMASGRWGHTERFCDAFFLDAECRPDRFIALVPTFREAVRLLLKALSGDDVHVEVDSVLMPPLLPAGAEEQLQILVTWGDQRDPIAIMDKDGPGLINPPIQRVAGLSLGADRRTVTTFGVGLRHEGREKLTRLFADMMGSSSSGTTLVPRLGFLLHAFANPADLTFPPRADIEYFGAEEIEYIPFGCSMSVTQHVMHPLTPWASITRERGEAHARGELSGACVRAVRFRIDLRSNRYFPNGRRIRGQITRDGYCIESGLDVDYFIAEACFGHQNLYQRPGDLLGLVG